MTNEQKAAAYDKACKLAAAATKKAKASYTVVLHTLLEMNKWQYYQRRTPSDDTTEGFVHQVIGEVACHETDLQRQIEQGKTFAESNKTTYDVAMAVAASYSENAESQRKTIKRLSEENDVLRGQIKALEAQLEKARAANVEFFDITKKLESELSHCRAMNADYLTAKTDAENRAKLLKQEVADLKVPESRQNRHLRDELHKVRLECQQAWEAAEKERKENAELRMEVKGYIANLNKTAEAASYFSDRYEAAKRQLEESNKQIEIYAKKVRNLEAELEEDGGLG